MVAREPLLGSASLLPFQPSETDLFEILRRKISDDRGGNHPSSPASLVPEIDVYGDLNPWEMFDKRVVDKWFYAFARLKQRGPLRFHRTVGRGSWTLKSTLKTKDGGSVKRFFTYEERDGPDAADNGHWSMHEFSLSGAKDKDHVICRVKNRRNKQQRTLLPANGNNNLIEMSPEEDEFEAIPQEIEVEDGDDDDNWEAILEELESDGSVAESTVEEWSSEAVIMEPEMFGEYDLESEEIMAMIDNFWAEPPPDMDEILGSGGCMTTPFQVAGQRELPSTATFYG